MGCGTSYSGESVFFVGVQGERVRPAMEDTAQGDELRHGSGRNHDAEDAVTGSASAEHDVGSSEVIGEGVRDLRVGDCGGGVTSDPNRPRLRDSNTRKVGAAVRWKSWRRSSWNWIPGLGRWTTAAEAVLRGSVQGCVGA